MAGPLQGINVLDFGLGAAGPWSGVLLGYLGANVVKVERPEGDYQWRQRPFQKGYSLGYTNWNMNKKAVRVDLKSPSGRQAFEPLLREADVVMGNFRPGRLEAIGMGYEAVKKINPGVIHAHSPGWGTEGPMAGWPCNDGQAQAFSGCASLNGEPGGEAELFRHSYKLDLVSATFFASTVVLGLLARDRTGNGLKVGSSHLGGSINAVITRVAEYFLTGQAPRPQGSASASTAPHQVFLCQDKRYLAVGVESQEQWRRLCPALGHQELLEDPRFATNLERVAHLEELASVLQGIFLTRPARWWAIQLEKNGVPYGYLYDFETLRNHAQVLENRFIELIDIPHQGKVYMGGLLWQFSDTGCAMYPGPRPGQHDVELLERGFAAFGPEKVVKLPARFSPEPLKNGDPPLAGLKVVEVAQGLGGPFTGLLLADAGAEVIKVEPPEGDYARQFAPRVNGSDGAAFILLNRNKQGLTLDLQTDKGREALLELLKHADVFVEDLGPGKAEKLGLGHETLKKLNPRLVYCTISPFGEKGPFRDRPGSELVVQMMAEYWASLGEPGAPPLRMGADSVSTATGAMAFLGVLAALHHRNRSGQGQRIALSMLGTVLTMRQVIWSVLTGPDEWEGGFTSPYTRPRAHGVKIGEMRYFLSLGPRTDQRRFLQDLAEALGLQEDVEALEARLRYSSMERVLGDAVFTGVPLERVSRVFRKHDANLVPINDLAEVFSHPQVIGLNLVDTLEHPKVGRIRVLRPPWTAPWRRPAPTPPPELRR